MSLPTQPLPTIGAANSTEDPKVRNALQELQTILGGNVDASNLAAGAVTASKLGVGAAGAQKLADITLSVAGPITFNAISAGYTSLLITGYVRSTRAGFADTGIRCIVNGNTFALYQFVNTTNTGAATVAGASGSGLGFGYCGQVAAATATGGAFSHFSMLLTGYAAPCFTVGHAQAAGTMTGGMKATDAYWEFTATDIVSSVSIYDDAASTLAAGSRLCLYGLS